MTSGASRSIVGASVTFVRRSEWLNLVAILTGFTTGGPGGSVDGSSFESWRMFQNLIGMWRARLEIISFSTA